MKKIVVLLYLLVLVTVIIFAQSAEKLEDITKSDAITVGQACYLAGCASEKIPDTASYKEAFQLFSSLKMFKQLKADDTIRMDQFSNIAMQATGTNGGLWYKIAKTPYYAIRSLKKMGIVSKKADPSKAVSGQECMAIFYELIASQNNAEVE